jgi:hypothetical protein
MRRRRNVQHGQKRRMPWSIRLPLTLIGILSLLLVVEIAWFFGGW